MIYLSYGNLTLWPSIQLWKPSAKRRFDTREVDGCIAMKPCQDDCWRTRKFFRYLKGFFFNHASWGNTNRNRKVLCGNHFGRRWPDYSASSTQLLSTVALVARPDIYISYLTNILSWINSSVLIFISRIFKVSILADRLFQIWLNDHMYLFLVILYYFSASTCITDNLKTLSVQENLTIISFCRYVRCSSANFLGRY